MAPYVEPEPGDSTTGFHPVLSDDQPQVPLKSSFIDHTALVGDRKKVRIETTWTYERKDGVKNCKYRKERWRVRTSDGRIVNRAHYIGRVEGSEFIPSAGTRAAALHVARSMAE